MLVVLAIVAMMAAVAVPTMSRMGLFSKDNLGNCARELQTVLTAARIYAVTYHVPAAVVFDPDPVDAQARMSMVAYQPAKNADFLPVGGADGDFDRFPEETCLYPRDDEGDEEEAKDKHILSLIDVDFGDKTAVPPTDDKVSLRAVVFEPTGRIRTGGTKELYRLRVAFTDEADPLQRYVDESQTEERMITLVLHRSTGRSRIEEDQPDD